MTRPHLLRAGLTALALLGAADAAHADEPAIVIDKPTVRATIGQTPTAAAYLIIRNTGADPDRLLGITCACAASVSLHNSVTTRGVTRMVREANPVVPPKGRLIFAPGGRHLMLMGVTKPIRPGDKIAMTLRFEKAGAVATTFTATHTPGLASPQHRH